MNIKDRGAFKAGAPSPLSKLICLGWYDGPTSGLGLADGQGLAFSFELLEVAPSPDGLDDTRIFALSPIPTEAFDRLVDAIAPHQAPRWPIFAPTWAFPDADETHRLDMLVESILASSGSPAWIVAPEDLTGTILAARVPDGDFTDVIRRWKFEEPGIGSEFHHLSDWIAYLGIGGAATRG